MPFTPAHIAAVLPLCGRRAGRLWVPSALVIGSMVPDLPYFVPYLRGSDATHAWYGPVTVDLTYGLALFAVWMLLLRPCLVDLAPPPLRARLPAAEPLSPRRWVAAALSVAVGATTHNVWDTFTHGDRWGTRTIAALGDPLGPLPAYKWLQYASGLIGLLVVAGWIVLWWRRSRPDRPVDESRATAPRSVAPATRQLLRRIGWPSLVVAPLLLGFLRLALAPGSVERRLFLAATGGIGLGLGLLVALCLAWRLTASAHVTHSRCH